MENAALENAAFENAALAGSQPSTHWRIAKSQFITPEAHTEVGLLLPDTDELHTAQNCLRPSQAFNTEDTRSKLFTLAAKRHPAEAVSIIATNENRNVNCGKLQSTIL